MPRAHEWVAARGACDGRTVGMLTKNVLILIISAFPISSGEGFLSLPRAAGRVGDCEGVRSSRPGWGSNLPEEAWFSSLLWLRGGYTERFGTGSDMMKAITQNYASAQLQQSVQSKIQEQVHKRVQEAVAQNLLQVRFLTGAIIVSSESLWCI